MKTDDRLALWRDIVGLDKVVTNELQALFVRETPPWEALTRHEMLGIQSRLTSLIHRLRELHRE